MKRFPEDDPEGLFPRRGRRRSRRRRQPLSALLPRSRILQTSLAGDIQASIRFINRQEQALALAGAGAPKIVLDTNVVSAALTEAVNGQTSAPAEIFKMVFAGQLMPVALPHLFRELAGLGPKRSRQNPALWTEAHQSILADYQQRVFPLAFADLAIDFSQPAEKDRLADLVPADRSDAQVLASAMVNRGGPLKVVTYDRHILDNAEAIRDELGIKAVKPKTWLKSVAVGLLAGGKD